MSTAETTGPRLDWNAFQEIVPEVATGMAAVPHALRKSGMEPASVQFLQRELAFLTTAIDQINFWNRIAAPFRFTPPIPQAVA
jgi:hypothetical protein